MRKSNYHSRSYHKFFDQWAEKETIDETGKPHIERVYVGNYYTSSLSLKQRILRRIVYALLYFLAAACFIISGTQNIPLNYAVIPSLSVAIGFFALVWSAPSLVQNLIAPLEMIIRQYRASSLDLIRMTRNSALIIAANALVNLLYLLFSAEGSVRESLMCIGGYLVCSVLLILLHFLEKRVDYKVLPPRADSPEKSTIIQFESSVQYF